MGEGRPTRKPDSDTAHADPAHADTADAVLAAARLARLLDRASGELGLAHYRVLALVSAGDERASRLAERLALGKPAVSASIEALVARGLVTRDPVAGDQRAIRLGLTDAGRQLLAETQDALSLRLEQVLAATGDPGATRSALVSLGLAIDAHLEQRRAEAGKA